MPFPDGDPPPRNVLADFRSIYEGQLHSLEKAKNAGTPADQMPSVEPIAVHCVAGLGRAPVLVATALVDQGFDPLEAVEFIRTRRRGAFNSRQIEFVEQYAKNRKRGCLVM
ncbi:protein-tyrosine phosphatase [Fonticula alba]|uniref:Protein-tyrosine phosphatase n=1 Tax=Fonticula alba TaxID=691883 RepID=A0A058Z9H7_FONAL|nr:protein-tyrosine phosphatase [Fonticula alba]KCV70925.1 protein-tyrosine phosphatase [Fonticula alba]|eukprot:XP_009494048.1 protein-tyrosine phosphatase [Fonticula alba]